MLNNILNYIEKNKIIFTIIVIFLLIVLIITYRKKYDNFDNINTSNNNIQVEQNNIIPLNIDSIVSPTINNTNMLFTTITITDSKNNIINRHFILGIYRLNDCVNLNAENHIPECKTGFHLKIYLTKKQKSYC